MIDRTLTFVNCRIKFNQMVQSSFVGFKDLAMSQIDDRCLSNRAWFLALHRLTATRLWSSDSTRTVRILLKNEFLLTFGFQTENLEDYRWSWIVSIWVVDSRYLFFDEIVSDDFIDWKMVRNWAYRKGVKSDGSNFNLSHEVHSWKQPISTFIKTK